MATSADWLDFVFGSDTRSGRVGTMELAVYQSVAVSTLAPGAQERVRVTIAPSDPGQGWRLILRDGAGVHTAASGGVWWRVEPGTWQPVGAGACVAAGRGRVRLDLWVRIDADAPNPMLTLTAETA